MVEKLHLYIGLTYYTRKAVRDKYFEILDLRLKTRLSGAQQNSGRWESNPHDQLGRLGLYH